jgi:malonyl-CoA O-methyltransferase
MSHALPPTIAPAAAARWACLPATAPSPWLHEEVARRMEQRLQWMTLQPQSWLHWEPLRGGLQAQTLLAKRYPKSTCFVVQTHAEHAQAASKLIAPSWWNPVRWRGPAVRFGLPPEPVHMLWANMDLHMAADPQARITQWHDLLQTDGFLMFSCLGPDTLRELRAVYAAKGWPVPAHTFTDMHDWGDMLVQAGFAEPVMDMERITLSYSTPELALAELRGLGRNLHVGRFAGLRGRLWHQQLCEAMRTALADPDGSGRLNVSFEIIYGHAFKPAPRMPVRANSAISLEQMRGVLGLGGT